MSRNGRGTSRGRRIMVSIIPGTFMMTLVIFGLYSLIEQRWLAGTDMQLLHTIHAVIGVIVSLLAAGVVAWVVLRSSPPMLSTPAEIIRWPTPASRGEESRRIHYNHWLIQMRWLAVVASGTLILISVRILHFLPDVAWWPLVITTACLAAFNLLLRGLLRRHVWAARVLYLQMYVDLVVLVTLLHFSGGIENPLWLLAIFHVILGSILLSRRQGYTVALVATALLTTMAFLESAGVIGHVTLRLFPHETVVSTPSKSGIHRHDVQVAEIRHASHDVLFVASRLGLIGAIFLLTAYFVTTLADRARADERKLEDMAERAQGERQLLERAIETTETGLCLIDRDLRYMLVNNRWKKWFGTDARQIRAGIPTPEWKGSAAESTLRDGRIRVTEQAVPCKDRQPAESNRILQLTTAPLLDAEGGISQVVQLAQEVTEQRLLQKQVLRAGKMAAVGELAGNIAHEVNNPIAIVSAKGRLLLSDHRDEMSERVRDDVRKMTEAADRVARIAQGLLSYCRPSGTTRTALDVRTPIRRALGMVEHRVQRNGVSVVEQLGSDLPLVIGNSGELEQVFLNLVLNAIDAMADGGVLTVRARYKSRDDTGHRAWVEIEIEDDGTGVPLELQDRVFDPFVTTKEEGAGTGLGLSVCLGLVRDHGGDIALHSKPGKGTSFVVRLPPDDRADRETPTRG